MNFKSITLICLILFCQTHQAMARFELSGVGEQAKEIVACVVVGCVAVYSCGRAVKDIVSGLFCGSKKEQREQAERKEKESCEAQMRKEEQECDCNGQLAQQQRDSELRWRIAEQEAQRKQENELAIQKKTEALNFTAQTIYKEHIIGVMQPTSHDLASQYEMYQEIEIKKLDAHEFAQSTYIIKRTEALRDHAHGKDIWQEDTYQISVPGQILLAEHGIEVADYQSFFGNQIQRTLHQEFVGIVQDTAQIRYKDGVVLEDVKNITTTITQFADIGQQHNHAGYIVQAFSFADFCHGLKDCAYWVIELDCDIAVALGKGVWKGSGNFINKIADPIEAIKNAARGFGNLVLLLARIDQKIEEKTLELQRKNFQRRKEDELNLAAGKVTKAELRARDIDITKANMKKLVKDVKGSLHASWEQITRDNMLYTIEKVTEVGTEAFLTAVTFQAVGSFVGDASVGLDEFIEAGHGATKFGNLPLNSSTMQACIAYEAITAEAVVLRAAKVAGIAVAEALDGASKLAPGLVLLSNGGGSGPNNPVSGPSGNILNPPQDALEAIHKFSIKEHDYLQSTYDGQRTHNGHPVTFRFKHVFEGEPYKSGADFGGLHQDPMGILRGQGFSRIVKMDPSGFNEAEVLFKGKWIKTTNFPDQWSHDQIMKCVFDIYDQRQIVRKEGLHTIIEGAFTNNVDIRIVLNDTNGRCASFYPMLK